jgi:hypothetical protein
VSFGVIELGLALSLVVGGLAGWWAHRRYDGRGRRAQEDKPGPKVSANLSPQAGAGAVSAEHATVHPEQTMPKEWDGRALRPNLNRQINLSRGLR